MIRGTLHNLLFRLGWDTRCRNLDVTRALESISPPGQTLLDVGCGEYGLAAFIGAANVIRVDINRPLHWDKDQKFIRANITSLPFANLSFPVVTSVDVLEHLPPEARGRAIAELVRVARTAVVVAFPCGQQAQQTDKDFQRKLVKLGKTQPEWLVEHLQNPYPSVESVLLKIKAESIKYHYQSNTKIFYSEHIRVTQILRWTASRSGLLYIGINLLAGLLSSLIPHPSENNSYRAVILVKFQ
ncbi:MAG: class I SAM-dependent methyltransferase [Acidobacteriota bacterium]|nr:class I SAM-dependent methyltransferase [Acidobacteriota bacterium]